MKTETWFIRETWIISIGETTINSGDSHKFIGTEEQVKKHLLTLVEKSRSESDEEFESGTESIEEIEKVEFNEHLYAYACYDTYHIDYEAARLDSIKVVLPKDEEEESVKIYAVYMDSADDKLLTEEINFYLLKEKAAAEFEKLKEETLNSGEWEEVPEDEDEAYINDNHGNTFAYVYLKNRQTGKQAYIFFESINVKA